MRDTLRQDGFHIYLGRLSRSSRASERLRPAPT